MRKKTITFLMAALTALAMMATPAAAHPITPPGQSSAVTFAGGASNGHTNGLACAENVSPAVGFLDIACTVAKGGPGSN